MHDFENHPPQVLSIRKTPQGQIWGSHSPKLRIPSSGLIATAAMLHACSSVDLYGVESQPSDAYHYYNDEEGVVKIKNEDKAPQAASGEAHNVHWFGLEHALYKIWEERGLLTIRA